MEQKRYRTYITDALMLITENTARFISEGKYLTSRWVGEPKKQDTRTGDEIAADVIKKAGIVFKGGER